MSGDGGVFAEELGLLVPFRLERAPDWDDVLARAGRELEAPAGRGRGRRRTGRLALALAIVVGAVAIASAVAAALGHDVFGGLSSWLDGAPGRPAPAAEQAAFMRRNGSSYAAFPRQTRLRLLETQRVGGAAFSLLGFRNGGSLCLRLVPDGGAGLGGVNQCVTLRELRRSSSPAVVASTGYYPVRGGRVAAVFGFADDTVRSLRVVHSLGGSQTVPAVQNVFLSLHAGPSDPIEDPLTEISAELRTGQSIVLPFTTLGAPVQTEVPSYLRYDPVRLPGPTRREAVLPSVRIAWLDRRERRGAAFLPSLKAYGRDTRRVVFGRSVQPDPDDPYRIGLAEIHVVRVVSPFEFTWVKGANGGRPHRVKLQPGASLLCADELFPLRPAPLFNDCVLDAGSAALFPPDHVLTVRRMFREAFTRVSGLAADGVAEVDLYLASGRVIPAALRNNVYTVLAPSTQWPAKIVAFDRMGKALEVLVIDGQQSRATITPCPPAESPSTAPGTARPYQRVDLGAGTIDGKTVLGRDAVDIAAALGRPDARRGSDLLYGLDGSGNAALRIHLARRSDAVRAVSLELQGVDTTDNLLGRVLATQPVELQRRIAATYTTYTRGFAYGSMPAILGCTGTFRNRRAGRELAFGLDPRRPSRPFVRISDTRVGVGAAAPAQAPVARRAPVPGTIAFASGTQARGFHVELVGLGPKIRRTQIASSSSVPLVPVWSPDGAHLLVVDERGIFVAPADGSSEVRVAGVSSGYDRVTWSPDSRRIGFVDGRALYVVAADGSGNLRRLTRYAEDWSWSPDGRRIVYVGVGAGEQKRLFLVDVTRLLPSRQIPISISHHPLGPAIFDPVWSPDGSHIVFACCAIGYQRDGNWLYAVRTDGTGLRRLYRGDFRGWAPDGKSFLVSRGFNAIWKLFQIGGDGVFLRDVHGCSLGCGPVAWLPDGKSIVYDVQQKIVVARVDGSSTRVVASLPDAYAEFALSPDGSTIAYVDGPTPREHGRRLTLVRVDGSHRRIVARLPTMRFWSPAWRP